MKRIIVCCDGTWNDPSKPKQTNVSKLYDAVKAYQPGPNEMEQRVHYIDGVGTAGSLFDRFLGGAIGDGLGENVRRAYHQIADDYEPGDDIFLFGFSRGAYTARSTLGMVRKCGILKHATETSLHQAWDHYRDNLHPEKPEAREWRQQHSILIEAPENYVPTAKFIGVWDTVGSLGVPIRLLRARYNFHDVTLTSRVDHAVQALAIDERRKDYEPTLWAQSRDPRPQQRFEQRWFAGAHSDVGGGAAREGRDQQSDYCLEWMLNEAETAGLRFDRGAVNWHWPPPGEFPGIHPDPGLLFKIIGFFRPPASRPIGLGVPEGKEGHGRPSNETVDPVAVSRLELDKGYEPKNLQAWLDRQKPA